MTRSGHISTTCNDDHCACSMSRDLSLGGGVMVHVFEIHDP